MWMKSAPVCSGRLLDALKPVLSATGATWLPMPLCRLRPVTVLAAGRVVRSSTSMVPETIVPEESRTALAMTSAMPRELLLSAGTSLEGSRIARKNVVSEVCARSPGKTRKTQAANFRMGSRLLLWHRLSAPSRTSLVSYKMSLERRAFLIQDEPGEAVRHAGH